MAVPYIPTTDAGVRDWLANFAAYITLNFAALGLVVGDSATINAANSTYQSAYITAISPATRNTSTIAAKDAAKANALFICRPYAQLLNARPTVTNLQRAALGLTIRDRTPTSLPAPVTQPLLEIINATPGEHLIRFSDALTPASRRKPENVTGLQLYRTIGPAPTIDPVPATFVGVFTRNPLGVDTPAGSQGDMATYFGRWMNRKGEVGPWSAPASMTIA
jgi:hypothetical protein